MKYILIKNAFVVNEGQVNILDVLIKNHRIERIDPHISVYNIDTDIIDAEGKYLLPGIIDDQVHFREPGLTHKADIHTESKAAVAGGVTSFMEMPNTKPLCVSLEKLEEKFNIAKNTSLANYSFYLGTDNDNIEEIKKANTLKNKICGVKIFMGSSTGNMLVDNPIILENIFQSSELLIATHCEKESVIKHNLEKIKKEDAHHIFSAKDHYIIRDDEACYESSLMAIQLAKKCNARLHILHISTEKELNLFSNLLPLQKKKITAEVCVHHLHFTADDYNRLGNKIKCNPSIKPKQNKDALWKALIEDKLDVIATDHAPHTLEEKQLDYLNAPAGIPLVQHSLQLMLDYVEKKKISIQQLVQKMCHNPAILFEIQDRGFIREGYYADLVLVSPDTPQKVTQDSLFAKCQWSPFQDHTFTHTIHTTWVNGKKVFQQGRVFEEERGMPLSFIRE